MVLALCHLCAESVNRVKICLAGGLSLMLRIVRDSSTPSIRHYIVAGLLQFQYDEESLKVRITAFSLLLEYFWDMTLCS